MWLLREHIPSFHNVVTRSYAALDGYDIMARGQNPYGEYEQDFYLQKLTVVSVVQTACLVFS